MSNNIYLIEKNIQGYIVIYGAIGIRKYLYYSKSKAIELYNNECKSNLFYNQSK